MKSVKNILLLTITMAVSGIISAEPVKINDFDDYHDPVTGETFLGSAEYEELSGGQLASTGNAIRNKWSGDLIFPSIGVVANENSGRALNLNSGHFVDVQQGAAGNISTGDAVDRSTGTVTLGGADDDYDVAVDENTGSRSIINRNSGDAMDIDEGTFAPAA